MRKVKIIAGICSTLLFALSVFCYISLKRSDKPESICMVEGACWGDSTKKLSKAHPLVVCFTNIEIDVIYCRSLTDLYRGHEAEVFYRFTRNSLDSALVSFGGESNLPKDVFKFYIDLLEYFTDKYGTPLLVSAENKMGIIWEIEDTIILLRVENDFILGPWINLLFISKKANGYIEMFDYPSIKETDHYKGIPI